MLKNVYLTYLKDIKDVLYNSISKTYACFCYLMSKFHILVWSFLTDAKLLWIILDKE